MWGGIARTEGRQLVVVKAYWLRLIFNTYKFPFIINIQKMEGSVKLENLMIAANCNTTTNTLDFNPSKKLIAYAAANSILILDPYHIND